MSEAKPSQSVSRIELSKRVVTAVARGELVDIVANAYRNLRDGDYLPQLPLEPLRVSGDDEHMWIGLAP